MTRSNRLDVELIYCILEELEAILKFCLQNNVKLENFIPALLHIFLVVCSPELRDKVRITFGKICHNCPEVLELLNESIIQVCTPSINSDNGNVYRTESLDLPITQMLAEIADAVSVEFVDEFLFRYLNYLSMYQLTNELVIKVFVSILNARTLF